MTAAQIIAALTFRSTVEINNASAPYNTIQPIDNTNWPALGLTAGVDTAKMLMQILDPFGVEIYVNGGYATNDYSSPDIEFNVNTYISATTLPVLTGQTVVVSGNYTVNIKVEVVKAGDPAVYAAKAFTTNIQSAQLLRTGVLACVYNCDTNPSYLKVTDDTVLGSSLYNYVSITRTLTITPPVASSQSAVTGNTNSVTINNLWSPAPYQYGIVATVVYTLGVDTFEVYYAADGSEMVNCNDILCKMYCCLMGLRRDFYAEANATKKEIIHERIFLGLVEYNLAVRARLCGDVDSISGFTTKFYEVTKCDPNCDCCDDLGPAPVISVIEGPAGPQGATGAQGPTGPAGSAGAAGAAGANGATVIWNDVSDSTTSTDAQETLKTFPMPAAQMSNDKDVLVLRVKFRGNADAIGKDCAILMNGTLIAGGVIQGIPVTGLEIEVSISRTAAAAGKVDSWVDVKQTILFGTLIVSTSRFYSTIENITPTWANAITFTVDANDNGGNPITCELFQAIYYRYGQTTAPTTSIFYATPFTTTNAVQDYPNVIGTTGRTIRRVYLDGVLLDSADWTYDNTTDILTFVISITGASKVEMDYQ